MYIFKYYFMHKNLLILIFYISFFLSYRLYSKEQDTIAIVDMEKVFENTNCIKIAKEKFGDIAGLAQQYLFYWRREA